MPKFENDITVQAPVDSVWAVLTNPGSWTTWFPNVDTISGLQDVHEGGTFQWHQGDNSGSGSITMVDHERGLVRVVTTDDGKQVTHTFDLDRSGGFLGLGGNKTRITYTREYDAGGGIFGEFISGGNPGDSLGVKHVLERLKRAAEQ